MKAGLALGGGGARGFAHIGVMRALEERGVEPVAVAAVVPEDGLQWGVSFANARVASDTGGAAFNPVTSPPWDGATFADLKNPDEPRERKIAPVPGHDETLVAAASDKEATRTTIGQDHWLLDLNRSMATSSLSCMKAGQI